MEGSPLKKLQQLAQAAKDAGFKVESDKTVEVKKEIVTYPEARDIMGSENFYGRPDIQLVFGITIRIEDIPEIPFSRHELERAKLLGQELVLYINKTENGLPLTVEEMSKLYYQNYNKKNQLVSSNWYKYNSYIKDEVPRVGWRLSSKVPEEMFTNKNYMEQIQVFIDKLRNEIFPEGVPILYQEAIHEFEKSQDRFKTVTVEDNENYESVGKELVLSRINQLCRETYSEIIYRLALHMVNSDASVLELKGDGINIITTSSCLPSGSITSVESKNNSFIIEDYGWGSKDRILGTFFSRGN